jgi:hypothetical protein
MRPLLRILTFLVQSIFKDTSVHKVFIGMTSNILNVAGMKTQSEFPDVYLDSLTEHCIPSALHRDIAKSEMNQQVHKIH